MPTRSRLKGQGHRPKGKWLKHYESNEPNKCYFWKCWSFFSPNEFIWFIGGLVTIYIFVTNHNINRDIPSLTSVGSVYIYCRVWLFYPEFIRVIFYSFFFGEVVIYLLFKNWNKVILYFDYSFSGKFLFQKS